MTDSQRNQQNLADRMADRQRKLQDLADRMADMQRKLQDLADRMAERQRKLQDLSDRMADLQRNKLWRAIIYINSFSHYLLLLQKELFRHYNRLSPRVRKHTPHGYKN